MISVARDVAPWGAIDRDPRIDFVEIAVAAAFEPNGFLGTYAGTFVFGDLFALLIGLTANRPRPVMERRIRKDRRDIAAVGDRRKDDADDR